MVGNFTLDIGETGLFWAKPIKNGDPCFMASYDWYVDGQLNVPNVNSIFPYSFSTAGSHTIKTVANCNCDDNFSRTKTVNIEVVCPIPTTSVPNST